METNPNPSIVRIDIAWKTVLKVLAGILLAFAAIKLWALAQLLIIAILIAVPLYRLVAWLCQKNWPRWAGMLLTSLVLILLVLGLVAVVVPVAVGQATNLVKELPKLRQQLLQQVASPSVRNALDRAAELGTSQTLHQLSQQAFNAAMFTMGGVMDVVLVIAFTIYLMVDGPRALQWLLAYFPPSQRPLVISGLHKIGDRMVSFIVGQSILSGLFGSYVLIVLSVLHVPMAVLLAVIACFLDVVPVLGIATSLVLGAGMGLTVSPSTALLVVALYAVYHIFENYFLLPKVYGRKLRLSTLAVLVSMIAGGMVAGVVGAIGILPLVAAYPALESLWLAPQLEPSVVKDHQKQLHAA